MDTWNVLTNATSAITRDDLASGRKTIMVRIIFIILKNSLQKEKNLVLTKSGLFEPNSVYFRKPLTQKLRHFLNFM